MLPKRKRISRGSFPHGRPDRVHQAIHFSVAIFYAPLPFAQYAVIVAAQNVRQAVARHVLRRRIYGVIRLIEEKHLPTAGYYVIRIKKNADKLQQKDILQELKGLFVTP